MTKLSEIYVTGLKNAHAMEHEALAIMEPQVASIKNYPEVAQRLQQHLEETKGQILRLESLLERAGAQKSALKDIAMGAGGTIAALGHKLAPDEIVKNSFANFAFEHYEIAAYKSLIALARAQNDSDPVATLTTTLDEEIAMSEWLDYNVEPLTLQFATLREQGLHSKN
ncbi:ferritin-like domain-containing protein [Devosia sp. MC1541]|uniref:ferritin-like domain-containing protein n=1 Tax=Devosia sp. MC1541 TaxID=2725264 RepID=UPI00145CD1DA|nr:ferritin-like domain-containing protein [Devosia sp. MC1541]